MSETSKYMRPEIAKALADALAKQNLTNDFPENPPRPKWAAFIAFCACYPGSSKKEWNDLLERLGAPSSVQYYGKMAELCLRALRRYDVSDEMREPYAFGWGYFTALLDRETDTEMPF